MCQLVAHRAEYRGREHKFLAMQFKYKVFIRYRPNFVFSTDNDRT